MKSLKIFLSMLLVVFGVFFGVNNTAYASEVSEPVRGCSEAERPIWDYTEDEAAALADPYRTEELLPCVEIDHGSTLDEVVDALATLPYEVHASFRNDGSKVIEFTNYNAGTVKGTPEIYALLDSVDDLIEVHNHPSKRCTFSRADVVSAAARKVRRSMVVSRWFIYILEPGEKGWPSKKEISNAYFSSDIIYTSIAKEKKRKGKEVDYYYYTSNKTVSAVAKRFGLRYTIIPRSGAEPTAEGDIDISVDRHLNYGIW